MEIVRNPTDLSIWTNQTDLNATAAFDTTGLGKVWPGGDTYAQPLLASLDAVKDSNQGSPIFRAYLLCQLVELMEFQSDEWGVVLLPFPRALTSRKLARLVGGKITSGDWFVRQK